jgi:hypothetical protein
VERWTRISQVIEFLTSFNLLFCTNWIDTSLRRATVGHSCEMAGRCSAAAAGRQVIL